MRCCALMRCRSSLWLGETRELQHLTLCSAKARRALLAGSLVRSFTRAHHSRRAKEYIRARAASENEPPVEA